MRRPALAGRTLAILACTCLFARGLAAQSDGAIEGRVQEVGTNRSLGSAQVLVDDRAAAVTDTSGWYRVRGVRPGWHRVAVRLIGFRGMVLDSVFVRAAATSRADFELTPSAVELEPLVVTAPIDELLDPLATSTEQKISAADLRDLPVSSLEEAIALSAGTVGQSYRGGRIGEESFILDGLGVKNQLDAASGGLGLHIPPDLLGEASLVTNGFSARYGQALSGLVNVVTRDPGDAWEGRAALETDRPFGGGARPRSRPRRGPGRRPDRGRRRDRGRDRRRRPAGRRSGERTAAGQPPRPAPPAAESPAPQQRRAVERRGQAGRPDQLRARCSARSASTPRTSGCCSIPSTSTPSTSRRSQRLRGDLVSGHLQLRNGPRSRVPLIVDLRGGRFVREFLRGQLDGTVDYKVGALTGSRLPRRRRRPGPRAEPVARPDPGAGRTGPERRHALGRARPSSSAGASRGDLGYNRFGETRLQLDATYGGIRQVDLFVGGEWAAQQVRTYQRVLGFLPVGDTVPPAAVSGVLAAEPGGLCRGPDAGGRRRRDCGAPVRPVRLPDRERGRVARRRADREPALRGVDGAQGRHRGGELRPVHPGARLPVSGRRRLRRHHAHRPLPPRQSQPRLREGHPVRVQRPVPADRGGLAPGRRVPEAARRPRGLGPARRRPGLDDLRQRRRGHGAGPRDPGRAGAAERLWLPRRVHPAGRQGHLHRSVPAQPPAGDRSPDGRHDPARTGRVPARLRPAAHAHRDPARQGTGRARAPGARRAADRRARGRHHRARALRACPSRATIPWSRIRWWDRPTARGCR